MTAPGPAGPRRRLGAELRRLRSRAGLHLEQVARQVPCSTSKVSRLETGKGVPKPADVRRLMEIYRVESDTERDMLMRLVRDSREQGWWEPYTEGVAPERFVLDLSGRYPALESEAVAVRTFDLSVLHGLLQTADYARAVMRALLPHHSRDEIEQLVRLRLARQQALRRASAPLRYSAVLDEAVLSRLTGGTEVMAEQLSALLDVSELPGVSIHVLPFSVGVHRAHFGRFVILEFDDAVASDVAYAEGPAGDHYLESQSDVDLYKDVFADAAARSLDRDASRALIARYASRIAPRERP
ncbi:helix-turn-helix transcriptional regulator [Pseudonocardia sp. MH-G8]|uniref:helix-turn-helix domain-containing protein n=1 Tax=Pseudonocardia sp. MH-G8 TaxID=1854588 RepID=UPI0011798EB7|nr:helix-turn-helix transcriptional regulator [Pseudonocardia sp. MH-G8]